MFKARSGSDTSRTHQEESESLSGAGSDRGVGFSESNHSAESRLDKIRLVLDDVVHIYID